MKATIILQGQDGKEVDRLNVDVDPMGPGIYSVVYEKLGIYYGYGYRVAGTEAMYVFNKKDVKSLDSSFHVASTSPAKEPMTKERLIAAIKEYVDDSMEVDGSTDWGSTAETTDCFFRWGNDTFQVVIFPSSRSGV